MEYKRQVYTKNGNAVCDIGGLRAVLRDRKGRDRVKRGADTRGLIRTTQCAGKAKENQHIVSCAGLWHQRHINLLGGCQRAIGQAGGTEGESAFNALHGHGNTDTHGGLVSHAGQNPGIAVAAGVFFGRATAFIGFAGDGGTHQARVIRLCAIR